MTRITISNILNFPAKLCISLLWHFRWWSEQSKNECHCLFNGWTLIIKPCQHQWRYATKVFGLDKLVKKQTLLLLFFKKIAIGLCFSFIIERKREKKTEKRYSFLNRKDRKFIENNAKLLTHCLPLSCGCVCVCKHTRLLVCVLSIMPLNGYQIGSVTLEDLFALSIPFIPNLLSNTVYYVLWNC